MAGRFLFSLLEYTLLLVISALTTFKSAIKMIRQKLITKDIHLFKKPE